MKANILSRLTTAIIVTMIREEAPLQEVIETVVGTLPMCKVRKIAYATFVVIEIQHATGQFKVVNFDSPAPLYLHEGRLQELTRQTQTIQGKSLDITEGRLERGDCLIALRDGVVYAGMGGTHKFGWGREQVALCLESAARQPPYSAETLVRAVMVETESLYGGQPGDDATVVGILTRSPSRLMVFTGPPLEPERDADHVARLMAFEGRKVVCGGTTANIVARELGGEVEVDLATTREDLPPIGKLGSLDLVTEGILTLTKTVQLLRECGGNPGKLPADSNAAVLLAGELLRADSIHILAGEKVNAFYQNPLLPKSVSIRRHLLEQLTELLNGFHKQVEVEWC